MIVDSHCHLDYMLSLCSVSGSYAYDALDKMIEEAKENDVTLLQTICTKFSEFEKVYAIAERYSNVFASVGLHPLNVTEEEVYSTKQIVELTKRSKVIGIGETGLDYHYQKDQTIQEIQMASFKSHIAAAQETGLALIVHTRDADYDTVKCLEEAYSQKPFNCVIHCFTASKWLAQKCVEMNMYISASGIVTFKNGRDILVTLSEVVPVERLLVETDSPYLAPVPHRGKRNHPAYLVHTIKKLTEIKFGGQHYSFDELAEITRQNFIRLFGNQNHLVSKGYSV